MNKYLVDTNIFIYHLNGERTATDWLLSHRKEIAISFITKIEMLSYPFSKEEEALVLEFLRQFELIYISDEIVATTIQLRRRRKIKTPDAIIAATALVHDFCVCTKNLRDFYSLGVKYLDPLEGI
jgi:predicted nucleic acid-binding protein